MRYDEWATMPITFWREDLDLEQDFMCDVECNRNGEVIYIGVLEDMDNPNKWELIDSRLTLATNCTIS